jgi:ABC-2 type transport system ATP-binding protein
MSGLDPRARMLVKEAITATQQQGRTIIICSHILADLDEMCPEIAILHEGHLAFTGSPENLRTQTNQTTLERAFLDCIDHRSIAA